MTGNDTRPQIELSSDEEWKNRVKAEDAALDQQFREGQQPQPTQPSPNEKAEGPSGAKTPVEMPEATFDGLVGMLSMQTMVALGGVPAPGGKKAERQLPLARYFIDLLDVLERKTKGNLEPDEASSLENSLHSLRMAYVESLKEAT